ncbi:MAG: high-potential iron-sulfur protein, partial [Alkalimonas sp.]|nr:high-potential iron-sulfur protein [Alkalimonas sp.]
SEVEGQYCHNCNLIQGEDADWRPCAIFPGKLVANEGWCAAWVKMQ